MITIIGSLRFLEGMKEWKRHAEIMGYNCYIPELWVSNPDERIRKCIDDSDRVLVYNWLLHWEPYIWKSTNSELEYSKEKWKKIYFLIK
jgi:hypothetical protein